MSILLRDRVVVPDDFNVFSVPRRARIGDVDAIVRTVLRTEPREAYAHGHGAIDRSETRECDGVGSGSSIIFRFRAVGGRSRAREREGDHLYADFGLVDCAWVRSETHHSAYNAATAPPYTSESPKIGFWNSGTPREYP